MIYLTFFICAVAAFIITPFVKRSVQKIGLADVPDNIRKVHTVNMPSMGGLAIYISFILGVVILRPESSHLYPILGGSVIIILTGVIDDAKGLKPKFKLLGQLAAAAVVVAGGVDVSYINLPFGGILELGWLSVPLTIIWIIGITNAINLIDGLDGLAAGVSSIVLLTITGLALIMGNYFVAAIALIAIGSTVGFLYYNFYPAKIFMGDTGALFLGFIISVLSILGFKNVTLFSLVVPIIILGVPISDTLFAIVRRIINKTPLMAPDKSHLHHCLLRLGYSHRDTVLLIYGISAFFGIVAIIFSMSTLWEALFILVGLSLIIELIVERVGLIDINYRPMLNAFNRLVGVKKPAE